MLQLKPAVVAPHYTYVGNFTQTSSKAVRFTPRNTGQSVNVPANGTAYWVTLWAPGNICTAGACSVCLFGHEIPIQSNTCAHTHDWLIHGTRCEGGYVLAEIITVYSFTGALFKECLVTWHASVGHISHEFTDST